MRKQWYVRYGVVFAALLLLAGCKPTVRISSPPNGSTYDFGAAITFSGTGTDFNDGDLTGSALVWTSNQDGQIGTGETFTKKDLSSGVHTITLTATNSQGQSRSAKVTITVGEPTVVEVTEDINSNTTWQSENIYLVKARIDVNAILTIEPGTVVKFESDIYVDVVNGKIIAQGTAGSPIIFTSYRDDTHGGDTNGEGNATTPAAGDWDYVAIGGTNNASVFTYGEFYYGGGYEGYDYTLELASAGITVSNCTFAHNAGEEMGVVNASDAGAGTTITGNVFYDNIKPLGISGEIDIDDSNVFHNPDNVSEINTKNGISFLGSFGEIVGNRTWEETEVPFVICDGTYDLDIPAGASLTLRDDVTVKLCEGMAIDASDGGLINAEGGMGSPIIFTSYRDDAHGGDTNGDGNATTPAAGDWDYVAIGGTNNASVFTYGEFYYGGGYEGYDYTLELASAGITVSNCTFAHNAGEEMGVVNASDAGAGTTITGNVFYDNIKPLGISGEIDIDDSNVFHNPDNVSEINTKNGISFLGSFGEIVGNRTWEETEVPFVICDGTYDLDIPAGASLTLGDNVVLKFCDGMGIYYQGDNLINYNGSGVWFTSYRDDDRLGDTNGDGSITRPFSNDWEGIFNESSSSYENWSNIAYDDLHPIFA